MSGGQIFLIFTAIFASRLASEEQAEKWCKMFLGLAILFTVLELLI